MRIVAIADTHQYHDTFVVPDGDVLVHAGDMCAYGALGELRLAADWILSQPHRHKVVVAGNHDWPFVTDPGLARALFDYAGVAYLEDQGVNIDDVCFYGSPWQPVFYNWAFNLPRGPELAAKWAAIPLWTEVLVTHGPPRGIGDLCRNGDRPGCLDCLERVRVVAPPLHVFGHIHTDGGSWRVGETTFVNATTFDCRKPAKVIDYSPANRSVTLVTTNER